MLKIIVIYNYINLPIYPINKTTLRFNSNKYIHLTCNYLQVGLFIW